MSCYLKRFITGFVVCAFLFAQAGDYTFALSAGNALIFDPDVCKIIDKFQCSSKQKIYIIDDLHCHAGTQKNIAKTIKTLKKHYKDKLSLIGVEGSWGDIDTQILSGIPDSKKRKLIADILLKAAKISGAEYFNIVEADSTRIIGVEDEAVYKNNFNSLADSINSAREINDVLDNLEAFLNNGRRIVFRDIYEGFDNLKDSYKKGGIGLREYIQGLRIEAEKAGINFNTGFPELNKYISADFHKINEFNLINELDVLGFRVESKILKYRNDASDILFCQKYLNIFRQYLCNEADNNEVNRWLENKDIFYKKMDRVIGLLSVDNYFRQKADAIKRADESMQSFYSLADKRNEVMIKNLLNQFKSIPCQPEFVLGSSKEKYPTKMSKRVHYDKVAGCFNKDSCNSENSAAVIIVGGYHSRGIKEILRARGIPYEELLPAVKGKADKNLYLKRLNEQKRLISKQCRTGSLGPGSERETLNYNPGLKAPGCNSENETTNKFNSFNSQFQIPGSHLALMSEFMKGVITIDFLYEIEYELKKYEIDPECLYSITAEIIDEISGKEKGDEFLSEIAWQRFVKHLSVSQPRQNGWFIHRDDGMALHGFIESLAESKLMFVLYDEKQQDLFKYNRRVITLNPIMWYALEQLWSIDK
ncbi:MAG: hypothetical protein ABH857_04910, partial [Elusimicrobiota bacterium]